MMTEPFVFSPLLKASEVAEILKVSRTQVYRLAASGELPSVRFGGATVRIKPEDLVKFIETKQAEAGGIDKV